VQGGKIAMIRWIAKWLFWFLFRWGITLGCALTLQNVLHQEEGYYIEPQVLLLGTFLFVAIIKLWTFRLSDLTAKKGKQDISQSDI
jgi:hypothetical protein